MQRLRSRSRVPAWRRTTSHPAVGNPPAVIEARLAERAGTTRAALGYDDALTLVCEATGWPIGHVWARTPTGWRSSGAWFRGPRCAGGRTGSDNASPDAGYAALREATALTDLSSGRGIVAAVLHLESCRFLPGLDGLGSPIRQAHAATLGLSGVVGVPVHAEVAGTRTVVAVLEFVTAAEVEPDGALAQALLDVAARVRHRPARKPRPAPSARLKPLGVELPSHLAG